MAGNVGLSRIRASSSGTSYVPVSAPGIVARRKPLVVQIAQAAAEVVAGA
ncbi:hypothetical protein MTQ01_14680 [Streptomyces sp. XM4193]|nr:hypothetical protein [Streptomyces sp. XM4193]MCK1797244.1 hypothetical protein [Streptomyces sp. XM4193]